MTKQKHGFWLFLASLIPGAGELYMGFRKQGVSIMLLFWGIMAVSSFVSFGWLIFFLPILWLYSFFNVHNLKSLSEEDFYSVEDTYILHLDQFIGNTDSAIKKHKTIVAVLLIVFGVSILWDNITDILYWIMPDFIGDFLSTVFYRLPGTVIAVAIIAAGIYLLRSKKQELDKEEEEDQKEHYWEPYRPYQQAAESDSQKSTAETKNLPGSLPTSQEDSSAENASESAAAQDKGVSEHTEE